MRDYLVTYSPILCNRKRWFSVKYLSDNLVMCGKLLHTHIAPRVIYYKLFSDFQNFSKSLNGVFAAVSPILLFSQWCSAPPGGGARDMAYSYYGVIGWHSSCPLLMLF